MANGKIFRRTAATAILIALPLNAASASDIAYFKDVFKPGGHTRSMTAKVADGRACGVSGEYRHDADAGVPDLHERPRLGARSLRGRPGVAPPARHRREFHRRQRRCPAPATR